MENPRHIHKPNGLHLINPYIIRNTNGMNDPPTVWLAVDQDTRYCLNGMGYMNNTHWPPGCRVDFSFNRHIDATKAEPKAQEVYCKDYEITTERLRDGRIRVIMVFTPETGEPPDAPAT